MTTQRPDGNAKGPALSVIVPIYNVEAYLDECLASVSEQEFADFEAILIDDGSTDGSSAIAQHWVDRDARFILYRQENSGLGAARNAGFARSSGRYIAFLDSDDKVPPKAYRLMIETLEETGSDFVTGNVHRFAARGSWQSPGHRGVCDATRLRTHVSRDRVLLRDLLAPNKLWRRDFWEREQISFPEGVLYEDTSTIIPAHVKARSVDVLSEPVVLYRVREDGIGSITQNRSVDIRQFRDRIAAVSSVNSFLSSWPDPSLKRDYDVNALERDLRYFIDELPEADEAYRAEAYRLINEFLRNIAPDALAGVGVLNRLKYYLISQGKTKELLDYIELIRSGGVTHEPLTHRDGRLYVDLPFAAEVGIPSAMLDATDFVRLVSRVADISLDGLVLRLTGWAYIDHLTVADEDAVEIEIWLEDDRGRKVAAHVTRQQNPAATVQANQAKNNYDWSGFTAEINIRDLRRRGFWRTGRWLAMVAVRVGDVRKAGPLGQPTRGPAARPVSTALTRSTDLRVFWDKDWSLVVNIERGTGVELVGCRPTADQLTLDFKVPWLRTGAILTLSRAGAKKKVKVPVRSSLRQGRIATAVVPVADLVPPVPDSEHEHAWRAHYQQTLRGRRLPVWASESLSPAGIHRDGYEIWARRNRYGRLTLLHRPSRARVIEAAWDEHASLQLLLDYPDDRGATGIVLSAYGRSEEWFVPVARTPSGLAATLPLGRMTRFGMQLPIRSGRWDLRLRTAEDEFPIELDLSVLPLLPIVTSYRSREYRFGDERWHAACLRVGSEFRDDEAGAYQQNRLRTEFYPSVTERPRRAVLYESYWGREFSDSPKEIFAELVQRLPEWEHLVVTSDQQVAVPPSATDTPRWSESYYRALAQAKLIVTNTHLPPFFERKEEQIVVQTWHGIGLKRVGLDIENLHMANRNYRKNLLREPAHWSYLISPNPFNTPILRRAFGYAGKILETGVPRNDIFYQVDRDKKAREVRAQLGVQPDEKLVLYAPTWRDDQYYPNRKYKLDLRLDLLALAERFGDGYQVLFRKHSNIVDKLPLRIREKVLDVSDFPDVQQILLVTDILITDYSTLMFDYANTGRPMIFYTYDLEKYRDVLRGFYFDFENEAPGPLITDETELIDAVIDADEVRKQFGDKYDAFTRRFCIWDDGFAAKRVADVLLEHRSCSR